MFFKPIYRVVIDVQCLITKQYIRIDREVYGMKEAKALISQYLDRQKPSMSALATIYNEYDNRVYDILNVTDSKGKVA